MKKKCIIGLFCLLSSGISFAQSNASNAVISADSLLKLFNQYTPFEVLGNVNWSLIDYKECYLNTKLWPYFLTWIDKDSVFNNRMDTYKRTAFNPDYKRNKVENWLNKYRNAQLTETVLKDSILFNTYLDSVIYEIATRDRKLFLSSKNWISPNALRVLNYLKLPNAYEILRGYWGEEEKFERKGIYFESMLAMQDPKAILIYNKYIDSLIATNDISSLLDVVRESERYCSNSIDIKIRLLKVKADLKVNRGSFSYPFLLGVFFPGWQGLGSFYFFSPLYESDNPFMKRMNSVLVDNDKRFDIPYDKLVKYAEEIQEHADEIEKIYMPLKQELIEKEKYWKDNMPYIQE